MTDEMDPQLELGARAVALFCEGVVPERLADQIRIETRRRGRSLSIVERRPLFRAEGEGGEWTEMKVAQLRFDPEEERWSLHWADRNGRWLAYPDFEPAKTVFSLLAEIERDPHSVFWG